MKTADIELRVQDRYTTESVDELRLGRFVADAVAFYSRYNPNIKSTTITTVSAQQDYDLPSDCILVIDAMYWPIGELGQQLRAGSELAFLLKDRGEIRVHQPSDAVIDDIEYMQYIGRVQGRWEQVNKQLRLWPEPTASGGDVTVEYTAEHVATGGDYTTIPSEDLSIMVALTLAEIIEARALEVSIEPDYAEGQQRVTKHFVPENARQMAESLRQGVRDKYGGAVVGVS